MIPALNFRDRDLAREGLFLAEGHLLALRAAEAGLGLVSLWCDEAAVADAKLVCLAAAGQLDVVPAVRAIVLPKDELSSVAGFPFHRGLLALFRRPDFARSEGAGPADPTTRILVLPAITDPGNLGTLLRSALAFGFRTIYIGSLSCDPFNRKTLRASMGASFILSFVQACPASLAALRHSGCTVLAAALEPGAVDSAEYSRAMSAGTAGVAPLNGYALVLGNEYEGIPEDWRKECEYAVMVPVSAEVDSLNVAIAGSLIMLDFSRQALR